ncbi:MAG: AraC family transcriptional regulator [Cyanobacteria bacterium J06635_1]
MDAQDLIIGERRTYSDVGCSHDHAFAQLILPLTGTLFLETQTHQFALDESSVFFLPPACQHYFYARDTNEFLTLDIPSYLVTDLVTEETSCGIRADLEARWSAIRTLLLSEIDEAAPISPSGSLLHLTRYISDLLAQPSTSRSLHYIHQHYHCALDVTQLAQIEGYSLPYYSEWFKAQTGQSPKAYLQALRLNRAKELLRHTDLPIWHIAQQVGFERASSLTRLFQQWEGMTPRHYRAKTQGSAN